MIKVAINQCFGGFCLSEKACQFLGIPEDDAYSYMLVDETQRVDANLIRCIETLGPEVNGDSANITIVEIPDDVEWHIVNYDGCEHIAENHRTWR